MDFRPTRLPEHPDRLYWHDKSFSVHVLTSGRKERIGIARFLGVDPFVFEQWYDNNRCKSWEENFTEALADSARALRSPV